MFENSCSRRDESQVCERGCRAAIERTYICAARRMVDVIMRVSGVVGKFRRGGEESNRLRKAAGG